MSDLLGREKRFAQEGFGCGVGNRSVGVEDLDESFVVHAVERVLLRVAEIVAVVHDDRRDAGEARGQFALDLFIEVGALTLVDVDADAGEEEGHRESEGQRQPQADGDAAHLGSARSR